MTNRSNDEEVLAGCLGISVGFVLGGLISLAIGFITLTFIQALGLSILGALAGSTVGFIMTCVIHPKRTTKRFGKNQP